MSTAVSNSIENKISDIRAQFPALSRIESGKPLVFFDGPAGTQVPKCVIDAISYYLGRSNANHGGAFLTSRESDEMLDTAQAAMAAFVGSTDPGEVYFGQNMTSLTFALSRSIAKTWKAGDEIIVTRLDHDANVTPWVMAAEDAGVKVHYLDFCREDFTLDLNHLNQLLNENTKLVAIGAASNATGGINPVKKITALAHQYKAQVFVDAVHYGPHGLIDVVDWDCDFLACSTYKFFGPHLGVMWARREILESLTAYKVRPADDHLPGKWMTGTQSHESIAGALECVNYLCRLSTPDFDPTTGQWREALAQTYAMIHAYELELTSHFINRISQVPGTKVYGITDSNRFNERFSTFSITNENILSARMAEQLAEKMLFVWNGNYYALQFTETLNLEPDGMVRIGLMHYNTRQEVDQLIDAIQEIVEKEST